jgi:HD-like signal output (HDOD) protein
MPLIRDKIVERLNSLTHLPSLPGTVLEVEQELDRKDDLSVSAVRIGRLIEKDMGISAKVLKIANSVFYAGRYGRIADIGQAVARLGIDEVRNICVTVGGLQLFTGESDLVSLKDFWRHSMGAALFIRHCGGQMPQPSPLPSGSYIAGLFHDIGILILDRYFHDAYKIVRQHGAGKEKPLFAVEKESLGIHHGEIGAMLLDRWRLPGEICSAVRDHHEPDMCPEPSRRLCQLINIATFACSAFGIPEPGDDTFQAGSAGAWHDLGLDMGDFQKIAAEAEEGITEGGMFLAMCL